MGKRSFTRDFVRLVNLLDGKFNTHGVRYAIRLACNKKAKVYYCSSLTQVSGVLKISVNEITKKLATYDWFTYMIDGEKYIIMKEYKWMTKRISSVVLEKQNEQKNTKTTRRNTTIKTDNYYGNELEKEIYEKLQQYFKSKKYSDDACKNHAKKIIDELRKF